MADIQIPPYIWHSDYTLTEIRIFEVVYRFRYADEFYWSDQRMAEEVGCSKKMVQRSINKFIEDKFIQIAYRKGVRYLKFKKLVTKHVPDKIDEERNETVPNRNETVPEMEPNGSPLYIYKQDIHISKQNPDSENQEFFVLGSEKIIGSGVLQLEDHEHLALSPSEAHTLITLFRKSDVKTKDEAQIILTAANAKCRQSESRKKHLNGFNWIKYALDEHLKLRTEAKRDKRQSLVNEKVLAETGKKVVKSKKGREVKAIKRPEHKLIGKD